MILHHLHVLALYGVKLLIVVTIATVGKTANNLLVIVLQHLLLLIQKLLLLLTTLLSIQLRRLVFCSRIILVQDTV